MDLKRFGWLVVPVFLSFLIGCAPMPHFPQVSSGRRDDMKSVVSSKGLPQLVIEMPGSRPTISRVILSYPDGTSYVFQTDPDKTYSILLGQQRVGVPGAMHRQPLPLWLKVKYPHLDWTGIPVQ